MDEKSVRGMLTLAELEEKIASGEVETVITAFTDVYGRLVGKRIVGNFFLDHTAEHGMHACDYLLTVDMEMEPIPGYQFANWERGYGDFHCVPDLNTLRLATWLDKSALVLCDVYDEASHKPVSVAPRNILKKQVTAAADMGYIAAGGSELEYFILNESYQSAHEKGYARLNTFSNYIEDYHILQGTREEVLNAAVRRHLAGSGVPVEFSKGEWGPGQHELNVRYADALTMADRHTIYKQCFKEVADSLGLAVTFMAKMDEKLAGSSCHIHLSLWDETGQDNVFPGDHQLGPVAASDLFRWFLGGWMAHARAMMPFYAPNVNSYKRYQSESWAPTTLAWSYDNRTAGFRVVGKGQSLRIESRIPGADVNPYLAYAAVLASGLDGIKNQIEPPDIFVGDVYSAKGLPHVPRTLREATEALEQSEFARRAFGDEVVDHYVHFFKVEQAQFDTAVTDWERRRYFEQV
jgi:glutamine synthetase